MIRMFSVAVGFFAAAVLNTVVMAQTPPPPQPTPQTTPQTTPQPTRGAMAAAEQPIVVIGCVQKEADYRQAHNQGRGGAAGTGAGVGDEFVLINVSLATQGLKPESAATAENAYALTGSNEEKVKDYVGKRVQITGKVKPAEKSATASPSGATAGKPATGAAPSGQDQDLRELEVISVAGAPGTCTPQ